MTGDSSRPNGLIRTVAVMAAIAMIGLPLLLRDCNLGKDLLANLLPDVVVGGALALWVGNALSLDQRRKERREQKEVQLRKAITYVGLLNDEVDGLLKDIPDWLREFSKTGWGIEFWLPTPIWSVLQQSGELPKWLDPDLVRSLSEFYDQLEGAKRGKAMVVQSWFVPREVPGQRTEEFKKKQGAFIKMTQQGLRRAQVLGCSGLSTSLRSELCRLRTELRKHESGA